ncbi:DUF3017 domain-containing protein [Ornithinimicrobium panacihumi]|uniref:DUF3017 domain-containing protein n=1 Tax=Ornithinimicrobium panacihumi TaxID=2008449 RepID=UPI003F8C3BB7
MAPESQGRGAVRQPLGLWWLGVVGLVVAAVLLVTSNVRAFGYAVGVTLGVLALLRAVLPAHRVGGLAVRTRVLDVLTLAALGASVAVLAGLLRLD